MTHSTEATGKVTRPKDAEDAQSLLPLVRYIWLDFQQMADFERDPLIVTAGKGLRVWTTDGRQLIDAIAGAMVSTLGYGDEDIYRAMHAAIDRQDFWPVLHSTTPAALRLAGLLAELLPGQLNTAFLLCGGSEATETAMKMARQFHRNSGQPTRFKVISRYWSYHGATMSAIAASGVSDRRKFEPLPQGFLHVPPPYCYRCPWGKKPESCSLECASAVEEVIRYEGRETVSALIVDPIMAAAGVLVPPKAYYQRLREIADRSGALLIFDEVLTGFGRTGHLFAANYYEVTPDLICLGKGITSGYAPVAAVVAHDRVAAAFRGDASRTFLHGHTYGGYPLGCETAIAVIGKLVGENIVGRAAEQGAYLGTRLAELAERHVEIGDVRGIGMLWGMEFVADRSSREPFEPAKAFAPLVRRKALQLGLITRGSANVLILAPALIATPEDIDEIVGIVDRAILMARQESAV
jgi:adenosylmethionine-8-amino-7-oxononanoate aminotransferase